MSSTQDITALMEATDGVSNLNEMQRQRLEAMIGTVQEVVGMDHLVHCLENGTSHSGNDVIQCYVGFEPS